MLADRHPRQDERLQALRSYRILDTEREREFDDIVDLAARICETPIALISFVDADRQWFKAEIGLGTRQTDLDGSICSHAILQNDLLEVPDTLSDPRTADNPLCINDPNLRFYAGAPMMTEDGLPLGTLCVLDRVPRELTDLQRRSLEVLAAQVVKHLDARRYLEAAEMQKREVDHRVKNSLQSIVSYARLLAADAQSDETRDALAQLQGRIATAAALHEELYKAGAGETVQLGIYLPKVCDLIAGHALDNVRIRSDIADVALGSAEATALAQVVNETVANALKHAFPDGRAGMITVTGRRAGDEYELVCADDGIGIDGERGTGLGLRVIEASVARINGQLTTQPGGPGHRIEIRFPLPG